MKTTPAMPLKFVSSEQIFEQSMRKAYEYNERYKYRKSLLLTKQGRKKVLRTSNCKSLTARAGHVGPCGA